MSKATSPKRSNIRLEVMQEVNCKTLSDNKEFSVAVMDIAVGGISLRSDTALTAGETLRLTLPPLGSVPALTVDCEIRWNKWLEERSAYQIGCVFKFGYKIDEDRIAQYVNLIHSNRIKKRSGCG
jgi:c-di-GMP-binding flagellar brake protein YcgR